MNREKYPPTDFDLRKLRADDETWDQAQRYEVAYQLARIGDLLEKMVEHGLPVSVGNR